MRCVSTDAPLCFQIELQQSFFVLQSTADRVKYFFSQMRDIASIQKKINCSQDERPIQSELKKQSLTTESF